MGTDLGKGNEMKNGDTSEIFAKRNKEFFKFVGLCAVIIGCYFSGKTIVDAIEKLRGEWVDWSWWAIIPAILVVQYVRRCVPPIYGIMGPISSVTLLMYADKLGAYNGALLYQAMKIEELAIMPTLRWLFSESMDNVIDGEGELWWLSDGFRSGLRIFDKTYAEMVVRQVWYKQYFVIWVFNMTYFFNDYLCLFWFSTRSKMPYLHYALAYCIGLVLEYPKTLFKFKAYTGLLDAASSSKFWDVLTNATDFKWYEIVLFGVTTCAATLFVHGVHVRMVYRACRGMKVRENGKEGEIEIEVEMEKDQGKETV